MKISIHYKITIIFCLITACILLGVFSYLDSNLKDYTYHRIKTALTKEALLAKLFLEKDFPGYLRLKEIDSIADEAGESISSRVTIIGLDGKVLGDSELEGERLENVENHLYRPEIQEALKEGTGESIRFSTTVQENMLYVAVSFGKDKPQGVVRLSEAGKEKIKLDKYDVIIMNPPFTRQERIPEEYKKLLEERFEEYKEQLHGRLGYHGYFIRLCSICRND